MHIAKECRSNNNRTWCYLTQNCAIHKSTNSWYIIGIEANPPPKEKRSILSISVANVKYSLVRIKSIRRLIKVKNNARRKNQKVFDLTVFSGTINSFRSEEHTSELQ